MPYPQILLGYISPSLLFVPVSKYVDIVGVFIVESFPLTIPHSSNSAVAPVVIAAAALVPVIVEYPCIPIAPTFTAGAHNIGFNRFNLVGPLPEFIYELPSLSLYPPTTNIVLALEGTVIVYAGSGVRNIVSSFINSVIGSHA